MKPYKTQRSTQDTKPHAHLGAHTKFYNLMSLGFLTGNKPYISLLPFHVLLRHHFMPQEYPFFIGVSNLLKFLDIFIVANLSLYVNITLNILAAQLLHASLITLFKYIVGRMTTSKSPLRFSGFDICR